MALAEPTKKAGGRYTKRQQEQRRIQVYHLHFEGNRPAVKIAELGVNRNTINEDIACWNSKLAGETNIQDFAARMTQLIQRMEIQRDRLLDDLEETETLDEKIRIERFISDIDNRLVQYFSKMVLNGKTHLLENNNNNNSAAARQKIDQKKIKEFVRELILSGRSNYTDGSFSENDIEFHAIKKSDGSTSYADDILYTMNQDGLYLCEIDDNYVGEDYSMQNPYSDDSQMYNLEKFADMRNYMTADELNEVVQKRAKRNLEWEKQRRSKNNNP